MHIKIYFGDKPVYLCDELTEELNEILHHPDAVFIDEVSSPAVKSLLHEIKKEDFHAGILSGPDLDMLKKLFFKHFTVIEAAGGIVQNETKEILFIYRLNKWDLPKGKIEAGENPGECAAREVEEETGVTSLNLKYKVGETYHTYDAFGKHILKVTYWYYLTTSSVNQLKPQTEEDITEVKWVAARNIKQPMNNTYPSIRDIMHLFFDKP
jgi:8-oxo-dGTP pyrophosphatase MutT (NUDIX family)